MRGVLRLALVWFDFLPLQRWLNGIGAALMLLGALPVLTGGDGGIAPLGVMLGATFIALTPLFGGGIAIRVASTRMLLQLQPHGRLHLMLGATLAITLLALLALLALLLLREMIPPSQYAKPGDPLGIPPLHLFAWSWSICAMWWIVAFILSRSQWFIFVLWLIAIGIGQLGGDRAAALVPGPQLMFALASACWTVFAVWYLRARTVRRSAWDRDDRPRRRESATPDVQPAGATAANPPPTAASAQWQYLLGPASAFAHIMTGAWLGFLFPLLLVFFERVTGESLDLLLFAPPLFGITCIGIGFGAARRARFLWLRTASDRISLYARAEKLGLAVCLLRLTGAWVAISAVQLALRAEPVEGLLLAGATLGIIGVCAFYAGMSMTRDWAVEYWLVSIALSTGYFFLILSDLQLPLAAIPATWPCLILLALLLRSLARHRWRDLDWRVARALPQRSGT